MKVGKYWVMWYHTNNHFNNSQTQGILTKRVITKPKPSVTTCAIFRGTDPIGFGAAICQPEDQFVKKTGRKISMQRALEQGISREDRAAFWEEFFK